MDEDAIINLAKLCLVEVKGTLEELPCTDPWIEQSMLKKIEGEFGLWKEKVPKVQGKRRIDTARIARKWSLNTKNGAFCSVAMMHIRREKLELGMPLQGDSFLVCHPGLIVRDLEIN
jgi:hypothetical protein